MKKFISTFFLVTLLLCNSIFDNSYITAISSSIDLTSDDDWVAVYPNNDQFDYVGDQQTGSTPVSQDIVGDETYRVFYVQYDETADELAFRVRVNDADGNSDDEFKNFVYVGMDANLDGAIDLFLGIYNPQHSSSGVLGIYDALIPDEGEVLNVSPSTTGIINPAVQEYDSETSGIYNFKATGDGSSFSENTDYFLSYKFSVTDINTALSNRGITAIDSSTPLRYIVGTAAQDNSFNQDIGGLDSSFSVQDDTLWTDLGVFSTAMSLDGTPLNNTPVANNGTLSVTEDTAENGTLSASDDDGDDLTYTIVSNPPKGTVNITDSTTGSYTYTPNNNETGTDTFTFKVNDGTEDSNTATITVTITGVNDEPSADDDSTTTPYETAVDGSITATDTDGDTLGYSIKTNGSNGTATVDTYGDWEYTPNDGFNGTDSFVVEVSDGNGGTAEATITITVEEAPYTSPVANNGTLTVIEDTAKNATLSASDDDGDDLTYIIVDTPSKGTVTITDATTDAYTYTPDTDATGEDTFTFKVNDSTEDSNTATVTVTITEVNDVPTALNDSISTPYETTTSGSITASDDDGDSLQYSIKTNGSNGTATVDANGDWHYTPDDGFNGTDSFVVEVSDGNGGTIEATITITVGEVANIAPIANNGTLNITENTSKNSTLIASDGDGDDLTYTIVDTPSKGTVTITTGAAFTYTPNTDATGEDTFTFKVNDGTEDSNTATITITVLEQATNTTPTVADYSFTINKNTPINAIIIGEDEENETLTYIIGTSPSNGTVSINQNTGVWEYTPDEDYIGNDTFTVIVSDESEQQATSTVSIDILSNTFNLSGVIKNYETDAIVENATITLNDVSDNLIDTTTSNAIGAYSFDNLYENIYNITVTHEDYTNTETQVNVDSDNAVDGTITENITLNKLSISLSSNPSSIVGDGTSESILTTEVTDSIGTPIEDVLVTFTADQGTFPDGSTAYTNSEGTASVTFRSAEIEGITSQVIPVIATVEDSERNLYGQDEIQMTFEPATINGVIIDNDTNEPVENAKVVITKDFNDDGIIDYRAEYTTGVDGSYSIPIPVGNEEYDITVTMTLTVGDEEIEVDFEQTATAEEITGVGNDSYSSDLTATGILINQNIDNSINMLTDLTNYSLQVLDSENNVDSSAVASFNDNGVFQVSELTQDETYIINIQYKADDGTYFTVGTAEITLDDNGEMNINEVLIDPYGDITDADTGEPVEDVLVTLYYADTSRNIENGNTPDTEVNLPSVSGFEPADNANPQYSDENGKYAWMVYSESDYYIIAIKSDYDTYTSPTISVEFDIVRHDITLTPTDTSDETTESNSSSDEEDTTVSGKVTDLATGAIIEDVLVELVDDDGNIIESDLTNSSGYYIFNDVSTDDYTLQFSHDMYIDEAETITVESGSNKYNQSLDLLNADRDIAIKLETDKMIINAGEEVTFSLKYFNKSDYVTKDINIELQVPTDWTIVESDSDYTKLTSNIFIWDIGDLDGDQSGEIDVSFTVDSDSESVADIKAKVNSSQTLIDIYDDESPIGIMVYPSDYMISHKRYIKGYPDNTVRPESNITRGEIAAIFARILELEDTVEGEQVYSDFDSEHWASEYIEAVTKIGLFTGYPDGTFKPDQPIKRGELATVIARYLNIDRYGYDAVEDVFEDTSGHYSEANVEELMRYHIIDGYEDNTFRPEKYITRTETIKMVNSMLYRAELTGVKSQFDDLDESYWGFEHIQEAVNTHQSVMKDGKESIIELIEEALW